MPSRSIRSYGISSIRLPSRSSSATGPVQPLRAAGDEHERADVGSRLIRTAAARPMPWLAPVMTQTLPIVSPRGR